MSTIYRFLFASVSVAIPRALTVGLFVFLLVARAHAQTATQGRTPLGIAPGSPAGSYALGDFDNVNIYNGNLNFRLPLLRVGGRGGAGAAVILPFNNKNWRVVKVQQCPGPPDPNCLTFKYYPTPNLWNSIEPGYGFGVMEGRCAGESSYNATCHVIMFLNAVTRLTFKAADGTEYELRDQLTGGQPLPPNACNGASRGNIFITADGTSATFISCAPDGTPITIYDATQPNVPTQGNQFVPSGFLMLRDGTQYRIDNGTVSWMRDRNGNQLSFTYTNNRTTSIIDSLNRVVNISYADYVSTFFDEITFKGFGGAQQRSIKIWHANLSTVLRNGNAEGSTAYSLQTWKNLFPSLDGDSQSTYNPFNMVSRIDLPDGRSYHFYYNSHGEMARVELPTGGAYEYDYTAAADSAVGNEIVRRVLERRVYPGGTALEGKTVFSAPTVTNPGYYTTTVQVDHKSPSGTILASEKHYFWGWPTLITHPGADYPSWKDSREFKTESLDPPSGVALRRKEDTWKQRASVSWWILDQDLAPPNDTRIVDTVATLADSTPNLVSRRTAIDPTDTTGQTIGFDTYNNPTDMWEYDFGSGSPGALLRETKIEYLTTNNGVNYATDTSIHLRSLPTKQTVYDANGTKQARTSYEYDLYDNSTGHAALSNRPNITKLDATFTTNYTKRGNLTATTRHFVSNGAIIGSINTYQQFDIAGSVVKAIDGNYNPPTVFEFDDRFGTPDDEAQLNNQNPSELTGGQITYAFPTRVTNALGHVAYTQYDYYLGRPVNSEDANGSVAKGRYDDALDRPTQLVVGLITGQSSLLQRQTLFTYSDSSHLITTESDQTNFQVGGLKSEVVYDGLGRTTETRQYAPEGIIYSTMSFDPMGRVKRTYNPYRTTNEETYGYTDTTYDVLDRVTRVEAFTGSGVSTGAVLTAYANNATTVTDQAGKRRRSIIDGLGRLIRVDEPDATGNLDNTANPPQPLQPTSYIYDVLDNLAQVTQGGQSRYFMYDSLKRLIRARNPEQDTNPNLALSDPVTGNSQWCMKYEYDSNSKLLKKTDSRNIVTNYVYDTLNRATSRTYENDPQSTPTVAYKYDAQSLPNGYPAAFDRGFSTGKLVAVTYGGTSVGNYTGFDRLGQVTSSYQQTASQNYGFGYAYNLASEMISETYPSGRVVLTDYDTAGRMAGVKNQATGSYWAGALPTDAANRIQYAAHGAVSIMKLGNGKWEHTSFNNRLQPTEIGLGATSTASDLLKLEYKYGVLVSNVLDITQNNGNVQSQIITAPKTQGGNLVLTATYDYDSLNRLAQATETGGINEWSQTYSYDRFGNRAVAGTIFDAALTPPSLGAFDSTTNRIKPAVMSGFGYDTAGSLISDPHTPANGIIYDAENRQTSYTKSGSGGGTTTYNYDGDGHRVKKTDPNNNTTIFVYNVSGQLIAEYTSGTPSGGGTSYLTGDHLGSTRVVTKQDGTVKARYDYLPFGEEIGSDRGGRVNVAGYGGADSTKQKFTQKERDSESGLDYFLARYYSSAQGRFTSADSPFKGQDIGDPQTWNLYAYTSNNPLNRDDPDGERWFSRCDGDNCDVQWVDRNADGSYTSPGEGWKEFIPGNWPSAYLIITYNDGRSALALSEDKAGNPIVEDLATGKVETKPEHIIAGVAAIRIGFAAAQTIFRWYEREKKFAQEVERIREKFKDLKNAEVNRSFSKEQRDLLRKWFKDLEKNPNAEPPGGLNRETLQGYREVARRAVEARNDPVSQQAFRLKHIDRLLKQGK